MTRLAVCVGVLLLAIPAGAIVTPSGAVVGAPAPLMVVQTEQIERGKGLFKLNCAHCHGQNGEGGDGPRLIGSPNGLMGYVTAQGLFEFVKSDMPADAPGSLKPEEYWDILAFVLEANKLLPPNVVLGPETARNIRLSQ